MAARCSPSTSGKASDAARLALYGLILLALAAADFSPPAPGPASVQVSVVDRRTGAPVPYASLSLLEFNLSAVADGQGRHAWAGLPLPGLSLPVTLTIDAPGYGAWTIQAARLLADDTLLVTADLDREPRRIQVPPPRAEMPAWLAQPPLALSAADLPPDSLAAPETIRVRVTGWPYCDTRRAYSVQTIGFREYLQHVLPNEWGARWHAESLRAGAMAAKMYAWYWIARGGKWPDADVYDSTCDQVYNPSIAYASTNAAVDDTWAWRLMRSGSFFPAYYRAYYSQCQDAGLAGQCMGQWDSKALADAGLAWPGILANFYLGTELSLVPPRVELAAPPAPAMFNFALRFAGGAGGGVQIMVDDPALEAEPPRPADLGATDFTLEWWMKAAPGENAAPAAACGPGQGWAGGNILLDRDRLGQGRKFGVSLAGGRLAFGVTGLVTDSLTLCGAAPVDDGLWHHVAAARRRADGYLWLWVDGRLEASGDGPDGDISYPDEAVPGALCGPAQDQACQPGDPYLVLGAAKHDLQPARLSFSGWLDEVRLSSVVRYTAAFTPAARLAADAGAAALYHFDDPAAPGACTGLARDQASGAGSPSHGACAFDGSGPMWVVSDVPAGPFWIYLPGVFH